MWFFKEIGEHSGENYSEENKRSALHKWKVFQLGSIKKQPNNRTETSSKTPKCGKRIEELQEISWIQSNPTVQIWKPDECCFTIASWYIWSQKWQELGKQLKGIFLLCQVRWNYISTYYLLIMFNKYC